MTNATLLGEIAEVLRDYLAHEAPLDAVQDKLQAAIPLLERTTGSEQLRAAIVNVEADLEIIGFTTFGHDVRRCAVVPLSDLLHRLERAEPGG